MPIIITSALYVSTKFHNSKTLLRILLQFPCSKTSGLPSTCCDLLSPPAPHLSHFCLPPCRTHRHFHSLCRLPSQRRIFLGRNLSRPFRCPLIRNTQLQKSIHFLSSSPSTTNQEYSWIIRPAPLLFICNPSCTKFQSSNSCLNLQMWLQMSSLSSLICY